MSPTSIGGGYRLGFQAVSISRRMGEQCSEAERPASRLVETRKVRKFFYNRKISF